MLLFYVLVLSFGFGEVISTLNGQNFRSRLEDVDALQEELIKSESELSEIDSLLLESIGNKNSGQKSLISNILLSLIALRRHDRTKTSNFPTLVATNISERCHNDSVDYHNAYLLRIDWAKKMYESTGKMPEALYGNGNFHSRGLFEQCLSVQSDWNGVQSFQGKYCTVFFGSDIVLPGELEDASSLENEENKESKTNWVSILQFLQWLYAGPSLKEPKVKDTDYYSQYLPSLDYCIPSSCTVEDFRTSIAQLVGSRTIDNVTVDGVSYYTSMVTITDDNYCYTREKIATPPKFDGPDIAMIVTLSLLGFVILAASAHELWLLYNDRTIEPNKDRLALKALHCFSLVTNGRRLLSTKSAAAENISCLNGIRVLSTTWIVIYHTYFQAITHEMYNTFTFLEEATQWGLHGVLNATIAVDTFFLMSGLLIAYSLLRELDRNKGRFNIGLYYLHRYLRLTPVYAFILGFIATLLVHLGSAPNWQSVRYASEACRWNWWKNLLYVNNYVNPQVAECMGETWYLACEMQMFLVSPLFIYLLWRWRKIGLAWAAFSICCLVGGTIAIFVVWNLPAMGFFTRPLTEESTTSYYYYYIQMWTRSPPYILGIVIGWLLHITKNNQVKMSKVMVICGWTLSSVIGLLVIFGMTKYADPAVEINDGVRVSYGALHRIAWATSVAWIVFSCVRGYGGFVNRFLSWKVFIPLSRLTYVVYLVHLNYLAVYHSYLRKPYYYTQYTFMEHYFGTILVVFLMAFAICLTIEVPFLNLEKLLISPTKKPSPATSKPVKRETPTGESKPNV